MAKEGIEVIQANNRRVETAKKATALTAKNLQAAKVALEAAQKDHDEATKELQDAEQSQKAAQKKWEVVDLVQDDEEKPKSSSGSKRRACSSSDSTNASKKAKQAVLDNVDETGPSENENHISQADLDVFAYVDKVDETCPRRHVKSTRRGTKRESLTRNKTVKVSKCSQEVTKKEPQMLVDSLCGPSENENHISQADLDVLQPGSRVLVYKPVKKCAYWNATVKDRRRDEHKYHFLVHFDGQRNNPKKYEWVEEDAIARIGID
eukprot:scaffold4911_cov47-Cyclotella_meneghiniana.AAC.9